MDFKKMKFFKQMDFKSLLSLGKKEGFKILATAFKNASIRIKMSIITGVAASVVIVMSILAIQLGGSFSSRKSFSIHSSAVNEIKKKSVERYFSEIKRDVASNANNPYVKEAMYEFTESFLDEDLESYDSEEVEKAKKSLSDYYKKQFIPRYKKLSDQNLNNSTLVPKDSKTILFQSKYFSNNKEANKIDESTDSDENLTYEAIHNKYHLEFKGMAKGLDFEDVYLIDPNSGYIVYSLNKKIDFATNLEQARFGNTNMFKLYSELKNSKSPGLVKIVDYDYYIPNYSKPSSFIATNIFDGSEKIGILVCQISPNKINDLLRNEERGKKTDEFKFWETFIIDSDFNLKTVPENLLNFPDRQLNSFLENVGSEEMVSKVKKLGTPIHALQIKTDAAMAAFEEKAGTLIGNNYAGDEVYSAYNKLDIEGLNWAIITERSHSDIVAILGGLMDDLLLGGFVLLFVAILVSIPIGNTLINPLLQLKKDLEPISNGDLTIEIKVRSNDEVGEATQALKTMIEKLRSVIGKVIESANGISAASKEMNMSSMRMSEGANIQASSAEEISSSMEQMTANIQQNTDNAKETEKIAETASKEIKLGSESVHKTLVSMEEIIDRISLIDDIAKQTNLLALTASVEAARAGDYGKGFALGATELIRLTDIGQVAANEIDGVSASSLNSARNSGELLGKIVPNIEKTSQLVQEIALASVEQNVGADQITSAIQQLNQVIQQNAATAEEMAASSEQLNAQADHLKGLVSFFNTGDEILIDVDDSEEEESSLENKSANYFSGDIEFSETKTTSSGGVDLDLGLTNGGDDLDDDFVKF